MEETDLSLLHPQPSSASWQALKYFAGSFFSVILLGTAATVLLPRTELNEDQTVFNLLTAPQWKTTSIFGGSRLTLKPLEARVAGVDIPNNKKIEYSLQSIYGVGPVIAKRVLQNSGVSPDLRTRELTEDQLIAIRDELNKGEYIVEGDLRREIRANIARLQEIRAYRGIRHRMGLPVRGQNTKNNARTRKGKKSGVPIRK